MKFSKLLFCVFAYGTMCAISTGICLHVGMAHLCPASISTARFTVAGMCSRPSGMGRTLASGSRQDKHLRSTHDASCASTSTWPTSKRSSPPLTTSRKCRQPTRSGVRPYSSAHVWGESK
jgi:hypothetical protein